MSRIRDLEGKPTRIVPGTADKLNQALAVFGIAPIIAQTDSSLKIGKTRIQTVKSYTTTRAIDFDAKVRDAIRSLLLGQNVDINSISASYSTMCKEIEAMKADPYLLQGAVSSANIATYVAKAQALVDYLNNENVKQCFVEIDAIRILLGSHFCEVIMD